MKENEGLKFEMEDNGKIPPSLFLAQQFIRTYGTKNRKIL